MNELGLLRVLKQLMYFSNLREGQRPSKKAEKKARKACSHNPTGRDIAGSAVLSLTHVVRPTREVSS